MSKEIRRLHRKQAQFTNFSSSQSTELPYPTESTEHDIKDSDGKPPRRRRRRDDSSADTNEISSLPSIIQSVEQNSTDNSQVTTPFSSFLKNGDINSIRAEFKEDTYHSQLAQSDFSDDTHDWGGDSLLLSDEYWHFLGSFE